MTRSDRRDKDPTKCSLTYNQTESTLYILVADGGEDEEEDKYSSFSLPVEIDDTCAQSIHRVFGTRIGRLSTLLTTVQIPKDTRRTISVQIRAKMERMTGESINAITMVLNTYHNQLSINPE